MSISDRVWNERDHVILAAWLEGQLYIYLFLNKNWEFIVTKTVLKSSREQDPIWQFDRNVKKIKTLWMGSNHFIIFQINENKNEYKKILWYIKNIFYTEFLISRQILIWVRAFQIFTFGNGWINWIMNIHPCFVLLSDSSNYYHCLTLISSGLANTSNQSTN